MKNPIKLVVVLFSLAVAILVGAIAWQLVPTLYHRAQTAIVPSWSMIVSLAVVTAILGALTIRTLKSIFGSEEKTEEGEGSGTAGADTDKPGNKPSPATPAKPVKKDEEKKSDSLWLLSFKILVGLVALATGLWPVVALVIFWGAIPWRWLRMSLLILVPIVMIMQGYFLFRIKHPEADQVIGSKVTQVIAEAERAGARPGTQVTWWMQSIDAPTKLKPVATKHPAHKLTVVEWDRNSVIHFRYQWITTSGKEKQVDYRWDIAHEPDYGQWTIWVGGKPTTHARWRMEWNEDQKCWLGSEEDTDGNWHSFMIYSRK